MIRKALFGFVWFLGAWREALRSVPARLTVATREPCDATDGAQPQPDATADAPLEPARRAGRRRSLPAL
ncbi:MAG: hypothetical protein KC543_02530, partial [Myxococcales bacterium]|nr:hypothetical protein [Myxococcales bacterium]